MNLTALLAAQHAAYEADLEPDNYGDDTCPIDLEFHDHRIDDDVELPCNYCTASNPCGCIDRGAPFTHRQ